MLEVDPEPEFEVLAEGGAEGGGAAPPAEMPSLQLTAKCAFGTLECTTTAVAFRPTMMFQTRTFSFPLKNTGGVSLRYAWAMGAAEDTPAGQPRPSAAPFSVSPSSGSIPPGGTQQIQASFHPEEVDSYACQLVCTCEINAG